MKPASEDELPLDWDNNQGFLTDQERLAHVTDELEPGKTTSDEHGNRKQNTSISRRNTEVEHQVQTK